jgi:hypothetical protein
LPAADALVCGGNTAKSPILAKVRASVGDLVVSCSTAWSSIPRLRARDRGRRDRQGRAGRRPARGRRRSASTPREGHAILLAEGGLSSTTMPRASSRPDKFKPKDLPAPKLPW